jgi:hypothetical protein
MGHGSTTSKALAIALKGAMKDPALEERLLNLGRQLVKFASMQQEVQQSEFAQ